MEFDILYALQEIHNPILDFIMVFVSTITNHGELWIAIGLILLCFKSTRKTGFVVLTALLLMLIISNLILKNLIMRDRPCWIDTTVELLIKCPDSYSFPSGHTASGFAAGVAAAMTDDFSALDVKELQMELIKNGVVLHEKDIK